MSLADAAGPTGLAAALLGMVVMGQWPIVGAALIVAGGLLLFASR